MAHDPRAPRASRTSRDTQTPRRPRHPRSRRAAPDRWWRLPCLGVLLVAASSCATAPASPSSTPAPPPSWSSTPPIELAALCEAAATESWTLLDSTGRRAGTSVGTCLGKEPRGYHLISQVRPADGPPETRRELHLWLREGGRISQAQLRTSAWTERYLYMDGRTHVVRHGDTRTVDGTVLPNLDAHPFVQEVSLRAGILHAGTLQELSASTATLEQDAALVASARTLTQAAPLGEPVLVSREDGVDRWQLSGADRASARLEQVVTSAGEATCARVDDVVPVPPLPETPRPRYAPGDELVLTAITVPGTDGRPTLRGELVRRRDLEGDLPTVVFVSGSGPQDRLGFVPGSSIDVGSHELHDHLARAGFNVVRVDDRGVGESELGDTATPGYLAEVDDARRTLAAAAAMPGVDDSEIVIVGHSAGALTALILANERIGKRRRRPAALVLLSGTGRNLKEVIYDQIRASRTDDADADAAIASAKKIHAAVERDGELPAASEPARMWMKEIFAYDPVTLLRAVRVPVLVAQGDKDFQVHPVRDYEPLAAALPRDKKSAARRFDGLDHLFKPEPGRSSVGHYSDLSRRVDPEFLDFVRDWLLALDAR